jgi:hypothetical protein
LVSLAAARDPRHAQPLVRVFEWFAAPGPQTRHVNPGPLKTTMSAAQGRITARVIEYLARHDKFTHGLTPHGGG